MSISWIVIVALVPAADRPYIDGTTNNNPFSMVFGYNALTRFGFLGVSPSSVGSVTSVFAATSSRSTASATGARASGGIGSSASDAAVAYGSGGGGVDSQGGLLAMFERTAASQIGWFFAFALVSIVAVCWLRRHRPRSDVIRAGVVMWWIWLVIYGAAYSEGQIHTYYVVTLAPATLVTAGRATRSAPSRRNCSLTPRRTTAAPRSFSRWRVGTRPARTSWPRVPTSCR